MSVCARAYIPLGGVLLLCVYTQHLNIASHLTPTKLRVSGESHLAKLCGSAERRLKCGKQHKREDFVF